MVHHEKHLKGARKYQTRSYHILNHGPTHSRTKKKVRGGEAMKWERASFLIITKATSNKKQFAHPSK
jgi:hypothetical protein